MIEYIFFALIIAIPLFVLTILIRFRIVKKARRDNLRYKLFAVRDQLIQLVAKKEVMESDFVFQEFYSMVNISIRYIDKFTLSEIIRVSRKHRHSLEQEENFERLMHELGNKSENVKFVVSSFFLTMLEILIAKSILLHILSRLFGIFKTPKRTHENDGDIGLSRPYVQIQKRSNVLIEHSESYRAANFYQDYQARLRLATG